MSSSTLAKIIGGYAFIFGILALIGIKQVDGGALYVLFTALFLVLSIFAFFKSKKGYAKERNFIIGLFVIYCYYELISILALLADEPIGTGLFIIIQILILAPFATSIIYFVFYSKEQKVILSNILTKEENADLVKAEQIEVLARLVKEGKITKEEYAINIQKLKEGKPL